MQDKPGAMALPPAPAGYDIELDDVVFGYREGQPILQVLARPLTPLCFNIFACFHCNVRPWTSAYLEQPNVLECLQSVYCRKVMLHTALGTYFVLHPRDAWSVGFQVAYILLHCTISPAFT